MTGLPTSKRPGNITDADSAMARLEQAAKQHNARSKEQVSVWQEGEDIVLSCGERTERFRQGEDNPLRLYGRGGQFNTAVGCEAVWQTVMPCTVREPGNPWEQMLAGLGFTLYTSGRPLVTDETDESVLSELLICRRQESSGHESVLWLEVTVNLSRYETDMEYVRVQASQHILYHTEDVMSRLDYQRWAMSDEEQVQRYGAAKWTQPYRDLYGRVCGPSVYRALANAVSAGRFPKQLEGTLPEDYAERYRRYPLPEFRLTRSEYQGAGWHIAPHPEERRMNKQA